MNNMQKINVMPWDARFLIKLTIMSMVVWIAFTAGIIMLACSAYKIIGAVLMAAGIFGTLVEVSAALHMRKKVDVYYDEDSVKWGSYGKERTIDLSKVKGVVYYVMEHSGANYRTGRKTVRRMEVCFLMDIGEQKMKALHVGDDISSAELKSIKSGKTVDVPIMRFYKFYEAKHPELAYGMEEEQELKKKVVLW